MKTSINLELQDTDQIASSVQPSLKNNEKVDYRLDTVQDEVNIDIRTEKLGVLRGCTDSVFRLIMLADRIYSKEV